MASLLTTDLITKKENEDLATQHELDFADNARPDSLMSSKLRGCKHRRYVKEEATTKATIKKQGRYLEKGKTASDSEDSDCEWSFACFVGNLTQGSRQAGRIAILDPTKECPFRRRKAC